MSARLLRLSALVVLLAASCACTAMVDPAAPPWRGLPGTTYARWEFNTPDLNPAPDRGFNPNGMPATEIFPGHDWLPYYGGRVGVWPLSGLVVTAIPNYPPPNRFKEILVQVTWSSPSQYAEPDVDEILFHVPGQLVSRIAVPPNQGVQWWHDVYRIIIIPNPPRESIRVQGAIWIDELVIDTICVPEPSSILVLAVGATGLIGLVRRRRK